MAVSQDRGHCRERLINESGIEQTVVAFDVTLKMPTSQQGTAAFFSSHLTGQPALMKAEVFEEDPAAWPLRGFSRSRQCQSVKLEVAHHIGLVTLPSRASASICGLSDQLEPAMQHICMPAVMAGKSQQDLRRKV
jgi:hypothetical protein